MGRLDITRGERSFRNTFLLKRLIPRTGPLPVQTTRTPDSVLIEITTKAYLGTATVKNKNVFIVGMDSSDNETRNF